MGLSTGDMNITDGSGNVVWIATPDLTIGTHTQPWDGRGNYGSYNGLIVPNGQYTIYFTGTLGAGDTSETKIAWTYINIVTPTPTPTAPIDNTPPVTTCTLSGTTGDSFNYTSIVTISLSATDTGGSGVKNIAYTLDGGIMKAYGGPMTVASNGDHSISYRSTDKANNVESLKKKSFHIAIPPVPVSPTPAPLSSAPKADFFADPLNGPKPLTVHFYDRSTGSSLTYIWDFGDGTSSDQNPTHVYQNAGTYDVALRVTNAVGTDQKIMPKYITVIEPGQQNNGGGGQNNGGGSQEIIPLVIYATVDPSTVDKDKNTVITVTVKDQNNTSVQDAKVMLAAPAGVTLIPTSGITNETGVCQFSFTSPSYGNYTLNATATKQGYTNGTCQTMVVVSGIDLSCLLTLMPILFVIVLIILLLLAALFLLMRSTKVRLVPGKTIVPADGKTTVPVAITLVNGLGRPKKAKKKIEVAMGTTAGAISDVTVPAGSSTAEAMLTSSKEFGPVIISANYGNKTTRANVDFKYGQASLDVTAMPDTIPADGTSTSTVTIKIKNESGDHIAPLEETIVELRSSLGSIQSPVKLPPKAQSVSAVLMAGETGGEAIITALMGNVKGETKVALKATPKRFCMHCGATMAMDAPRCPKCGLTPPSGVDVKQCTTCGNVIPESAKYCHSCGSRQPERAVADNIAAKPSAPQPKKE